MHFMQHRIGRGDMNTLLRDNRSAVSVKHVLPSNGRQEKGQNAPDHP